MAFDIRTLAVLQGIAWVVFALTTLVMVRVHPQESHLRDWSVGATLCALGSVFHAIGPATFLFLSTVVGNTLLSVGGGVLFLGLRGLLGLSRPAWVPWAVLGLGVPPLLWLTYAQPNFSARVMVVSALFVVPLVASAWAVWCNVQTRALGRLQWVNLLMLLVYVGGAGVFTWRLLYAGYNLSESKLVFASSWLYAAPYLWCILYNIWLPIAITLTVSERLQCELALARDRADADSEAKSRFLASMSHEIRTPMNGILGMAQLLQKPYMDAAKRQESARIIVQSGQVLLTLLNDILDLSKVEAGKFELVPVPCQPQQLICEIEALFAESANHQGLRLLSHWSGPDGATYSADAMRLRQMLSNLVGNAIKFTPRGHVYIDAHEVSRYDGGALLEFTVTDTGIGLSDEQIGRLFIPFSQADNSVTREYGGSGLGLSIVRRWARLMGGDAGVQSQLGQGARFWFRVQVQKHVSEAAPLAPVAVAAAAQVLPVLPALRVPPGATVLVVEDNPINLVVVSAMLENLGLIPVIAEDGEQAVQALAQLQQHGTPPLLVLMDIQMPVLGGLAATERIRAWEQQHSYLRVPIIALTANAYPEDRQRCLNAGMDDFLAKPLSLGRLRTALAQWLNGPAA